MLITRDRATCDGVTRPTVLRSTPYNVAGSIFGNFRYRGALVWGLKILLAALFLFEGIDKFSERRLWVRIFAEIGFGQWFRYFTGAVEVIGAVALLIPKATLFGVGVLVCTMIGAALTHFFVIGVGPQTVVIALLVVMLLIVGASTPIGGGRGRNT